MTILFLGNIGSGKTLNAVRWLCYQQKRGFKTYSNIKTKGIPNSLQINSEMIVKTEIEGYKKNGQPIIKKCLNTEFWKSIGEPINVIIDEAHSILFNSRSSMSKNNKIATDWLALLRRVLGESSYGQGELILISQLSRRLDVIAQEMAHEVRYFIGHYYKRCQKCNSYWHEHSDMAEKLWMCPRCGSYKIKKEGHYSEVWHFQGMGAFISWRDYKTMTYFKHYYVNDIEKYFPMYDTLQWDNLFNEIYQ